MSEDWDGFERRAPRRWWWPWGAVAVAAYIAFVVWIATKLAHVLW